MNERCKTCPMLCKRLGLNDQPRYYSFNKLSPAKVIEFIAAELRTQRRYYLHLDTIEQSAGNRLAFMLKPQYLDLSEYTSLPDDHILVIAQSREDKEGAVLWFCYDMPERRCDCLAVSSELTEIITTILNDLTWCNQHTHRHQLSKTAFIPDLATSEAILSSVELA